MVFHELLCLFRFAHSGKEAVQAQDPLQIAAAAVVLGGATRYEYEEKDGGSEMEGALEDEWRGVGSLRGAMVALGGRHCGRGGCEGTLLEEPGRGGQECEGGRPRRTGEERGGGENECSEWGWDMMMSCFDKEVVFVHIEVVTRHQAAAPCPAGGGGHC
eukprot:Cvel_11486.t1-p1 / transcript=Cvel_11486.t1 / gene=Cvel_11486 / organism=Chromera_velia_CCMP2878 / gene_product=hypothetical protein / transcript_product=hypothetical protein / location=Cvel_scaffold723:70357-70832(+) / protein_length=158 / sequence_SO=supercontig / SO=protein_coding / is_pseudo=false